MDAGRVRCGPGGPIRALAATALVAAIAGCGDGATPQRPASEAATRAAAPPASVASPVALHESVPAPDDAPRADDLQHWAVNALLFTILDDDHPPRWTDPEVWAGCAPGTEVRVDHRPLVVGQHIPEGAFDLTWQAVDCRPMGLDGPVLNGRVTLRLEPRGSEGWIATVATDRLEWTGRHGRVVLPPVFIARAPAADLPPAAR